MVAIASQKRQFAPGGQALKAFTHTPSDAAEGYPEIMLNQIMTMEAATTLIVEFEGGEIVVFSDVPAYTYIPGPIRRVKATEAASTTSVASVMAWA